MAEESIGSRLRAALGLRRWNQSDLVRETGLDKNTVSAIVNDRQRPNPGTLGRIEQALGLTPGTLAGSREESQPFRLGMSTLGGPEVLGRDLSAVSNDELVGELSARLRALRERIRELEPTAERERRRAERRRDYLLGISEDSSAEERWIAQEWNRLQFAASGEGGGWGPDEHALHESLCDQIDALAWAYENELIVVERHGPDPGEGGHVPPAEDWAGFNTFDPVPRGVVQLPQHVVDALSKGPVKSEFELAARRGSGQGRKLRARLDLIGEEHQTSPDEDHIP